jgi:Flp pilus assembly protein TadD
MPKQRTSGPSSSEEFQRLLSTGASLLEQGDAQAAIPILEQAYHLDTASVPVLINLGGAYVVTGKQKKAISLLEAARDAEPDNTMIWINLGAAYLGNPVLASPQQQEMAIIAFENALDKDPDAPNVYYNLGLIHVDRGDTASAEASFRAALQANPFDRDARNWLNKLAAKEEKGGDNGA